MEKFSTRIRLDSPVEKVFEWYSRPGAFDRLNPPWKTVKVLERTGGIDKGARRVVELRMGPIKQTSVFENRDYKKNKRFKDVQVSGPFQYWEHTHYFESSGKDSSYIEDKIDYELPRGLLVRYFLRNRIRDRLLKIFRYRHTITKNDLSVHSTSNNKSKKILITGSTGFIGSQLIPFLTTGGHSIVSMLRPSTKADTKDAIYWDPAKGTIDSSKLEGMDVVIHLSGENIAGGRWTEERKEAISKSRIESTKLLSETLSELRKPPEVLASASAIGYYGDTGETIITERSPLGSGFLPAICQEWERSTKAASSSGIRVVNLRNGVVLNPLGGFLKKVLTLFRLGLGGKIGSGKQYLNWISMDDLLYIVLYVINNRSVTGPINVTSPNPVTNEEFSKTLGHVLSRPTVFSVPAFAPRLLYGDMAKDLILGGCRAIPENILTWGFKFYYPTLEEALRHTLGK